jgi:hypothetical protein
MGANGVIGTRRVDVTGTIVVFSHRDIHPISGATIPVHPPCGQI